MTNPTTDQMPGRVITEAPQIPSGRPKEDGELSKFDSSVTADDVVRVLERHANDKTEVYSAAVIGAMQRSGISEPADLERIAEAAENGTKTMVSRHRYDEDGPKVAGYKNVADYARNTIGAQGAAPLAVLRPPPKQSVG